MSRNGGEKGKAGKTVGIILLSLLGLVLLALTAGFAYEKSCEAADARAYPPTGKLYDVGDGIKLNLVSMGTAPDGIPTVVIEAGMGDSAAAWQKVASLISVRTRVVTYDRAGLGYSSYDSKPRDAKRIATQLHTLLENAGIAGPIVLVGHSIGGVYVREYYGLFPQNIAALVLLESSHPDQMKRMPPDILKLQNDQIDAISKIIPLAEFGIIRLQKPEALGISAPDGLSEKEKKGFIATSILPSYFKTNIAEFRAIDADFEEAGAINSFGDTPLVVMSNGLGQMDTSALPPGVSKESFEKMNASWQDMQNEFPAFSSRSVHLFADHSHHNIQTEEPEAAARAIGTALDMVAGNYRPEAGK